MAMENTFQSPQPPDQDGIQHMEDDSGFVGNVNNPPSPWRKQNAHQVSPHTHRLGSHPNQSEFSHPFLPPVSRPEQEMMLGNFLRVEGRERVTQKRNKECRERSEQSMQGYAKYISCAAPSDTIKLCSKLKYGC